MCIAFQNDPVHMSQPTLDLFWNAVSEFHGEGETNIVICLKEQQSCLASDKAAEFENKSEGRRWLWETWEDEHIFSGNGWSEDFWVQRYKKTWKDTWRNSTNPMPPSLHAIAFHLPILNCDTLLRLQCCCGKWRDMMKSDLCCCWQLPRVVILQSVTIAEANSQSCIHTGGQPAVFYSVMFWHLLSSPNLWHLVDIPPFGSRVVVRCWGFIKDEARVYLWWPNVGSTSDGVWDIENQWDSPPSAQTTLCGWRKMMCSCLVMKIEG